MCEQQCDWRATSTYRGDIQRVVHQPHCLILPLQCCGAQALLWLASLPGHSLMLRLLHLLHPAAAAHITAACMYAIVYDAGIQVW